MNLRDRILRELDRQAQIEGETQNIEECRIILNHTKAKNDWDALVGVQWHKYGTQSFEAWRFYYVRPWVLSMVNDLVNKD